MNKECIYINGNVLVEDENRKKKEVQYQDNIEEILYEENVIESIGNKRNELIYKKARINLKLKKKTNKVFRIILILSSIISAVIIPQTMISTTALLGVFHVKDVVTIALLIASIAFNVFDVVSEKKEKENLRKETSAITCELEFLYKQLDKEKEKLEELNNNKTKENIPEGLKISKINDRDLLENIKHNLELHYNLGYNLEQYYKYLEDGILEEKINEEYSQSDVDNAIEFLEEKGLMLSRRK